MNHLKINKQMVEIRVPASSANLGPGFDSFGLAVPLYLTVRVKLADEISIQLIGGNLENIPTDKTNAIYQTFQYLFELEGVPAPSAAMEIESEIPLSRGLGSSAAAIVAGLLAANQFLENPKTVDDLFQIATRIEGHPDNIGASLFGGFIVAAQDGDHAKIIKLPFPQELKVILAIPDYPVSTKTARGQIPERIPLKDVRFNIGHAALLVSYILTGQLDKLSLAVKDRVHQPYRQHAVKGLQRLLENGDNTGLFSTALSGAGPAVIFFVQEQHTAMVQQKIQQIAQEEKVEMDIKILMAEPNGATVMEMNNHI